MSFIGYHYHGGILRYRQIWLGPLIVIWDRAGGIRSYLFGRRLFVRDGDYGPFEDALLKLYGDPRRDSGRLPKGENAEGG